MTTGTHTSHCSHSRHSADDPHHIAQSTSPQDLQRELEWARWALQGRLQVRAQTAPFPLPAQSDSKNLVLLVTVVDGRLAAKHQRCNNIRLTLTIIQNKVFTHRVTPLLGLHFGNCFLQCTAFTSWQGFYDLAAKRCSITSSCASCCQRRKPRCQLSLCIKKQQHRHTVSSLPWHRTHTFATSLTVVSASKSGWPASPAVTSPSSMSSSP